MLVVAAVALALPHVLHDQAAAPPPPPPPPPKPFRVIFPEGFTRAQMTDRVSAVAKIAERKRNRPVRLSGPAVPARHPDAVVSVLRAAPAGESRGLPLSRDVRVPREDDVEPAGRRPAADVLRATGGPSTCAYARSKNLTPYDVLTIASMVERETIAPSERPLVAAVIYNRLHARMPLGIDATLRYGLHIPPTQSILESQLQSDNPYNTRKLTGLPPTPIANPGLASIRAAAHPAKVDYLYFVRKPDKIHHFFTASDTAFAQYECAHGYGC